MAKNDNLGIWEKIQKGVQDTERLMGQKKYNLSMIKARETIEYMIQLHCEKADIAAKTPEDAVRALYESRDMKKSTAERYLQVLALGEKADLEGDNSAYNANQAHHILSQEIYSFVDVDKAAKNRRSSSRQRPQPQSRRRRTSRSGLQTSDLLKLLIPIVLIVVLLLLIKVLSPKKEATDETTTPPAVTQEQQTEPSTETTAPPETTAPSVTYKTTTTLNVRSAPSTESERIGKLDPDKTVEFIRDHDDFWAVIRYNEQEAYVAKEYLTTVE